MLGLVFYILLSVFLYVFDELFTILSFFLSLPLSFLPFYFNV